MISGFNFLFDVIQLGTRCLRSPNSYIFLILTNGNGIVCWCVCIQLYVWQTVQTLIRSHGLWRLIRVYIVYSDLSVRLRRVYTAHELTIYMYLHLLHVWPTHPGAHVQVNVFPTTVHRPWSHGEGTHGSRAAKWKYSNNTELKYDKTQWLNDSMTRTSITKTYLYNFDPLKPHFYIVKLGFTGVNIIFLISAQNIDCGYSLERVPTIFVLCRNMKKIWVFLSENFQFLEIKFSIYLNRRVFVMFGTMGICSPSGVIIVPGQDLLRIRVCRVCLLESPNEYSQCTFSWWNMKSFLKYPKIFVFFGGIS